jgi:hypothetical protein
LFQIDTCADISLIKGNTLRGTTKYDQGKKVNTKCVEISELETFGIIQAKVQIGKNSSPFEFQLVNKQVDIPCDGILRRHFVSRTKAHM